MAIVYFCIYVSAGNKTSFNEKLQVIEVYILTLQIQYKLPTLHLLEET